VPEETSQIVAEGRRPVESTDPVQGFRDGVGAADILPILAGRKRLLFAATISGGLLATAVAFLLPNMYTASAVILPPQKEQSSAAMLIGQLGPLAAAAGADLGLKNPADMYVGLLGSRTIADHLIARFGLMGLYQKNTLTDTRSKLWKRSRFSAGRDSLIRVEVDDHDPKRAADMANAFVSELDEQNRRLAISEASQRRQLLESQLVDEKSALAVAEEDMKSTQQRTGIIEVTGQTQVAIASLAQLRAQITVNEVALQRLKMGATPENPAVLQTETELAEMRAQLLKLEKSSPDGDPLMATSAIPAAGLGYLRRLRDLKYHEFLFELLSKQYEAARIDEAKASPAIQVVDTAIPPDKKSGPLRTLIILLGCLVGGGFPVVYAYVQQGLKPVRTPGQS
jgi:uncharacterized protein involved in exopolysaccharide biosynthesis